MGGNSFDSRSSVTWNISSHPEPRVNEPTLIAIKLGPNCHTKIPRYVRNCEVYVKEYQASMSSKLTVAKDMAVIAKAKTHANPAKCQRSVKGQGYTRQYRQRYFDCCRLERQAILAASTCQQI